MLTERNDTGRMIPPEIEKPARYTGGELNSVIKTEYELDFGFCFPDIYEIGMSHVGLNLLYELLNSRENVFAERYFAPWKDMADSMKERGELLSSLETGRPLKDTDIAGFNISYEMCYTTILDMLDMGGIPVLASQRDDSYPVIVGGGSCVVNPEPVADFFDVFVPGDGEEAILRLCDIYIKHKKKGFSKSAYLRELAETGGFYVPSMYTVNYHPDGRVAKTVALEGAPEKVERNILTDFDGAFMITRPVVPFVNTVHDRCTLEIMRGCTRGCRFCQAGYIYRPVRERSAERILREAESVIDSTGYDEISLASLSSGDYSEINKLVGDLLDRFEERRVSVSLPSMRVDSFAPEVAEKLQRVRQTGLTFAPEAGSQRLRDVINKNITEEDILGTVREAFASGINTVKLYFMIGLPTETYEDLDGIVDLVKKIKGLYYETPKELRNGMIRINVSASNFVPKPQTPFQWCAQNRKEELLSKQDYLFKNLKMKGVKFSCHDVDTSFMEAVLARGDRRMSRVILDAYKKGCRLESWSENFDINLWRKLFAKNDLDPSWYACRERGEDEVFPFEHIDYLIDRAYLWKEYSRAIASETTDDCRKHCMACGLQGKGCNMHKGEKV